MLIYSKQRDNPIIIKTESSDSIKPDDIIRIAFDTDEIHIFHKKTGSSLVL